MSPSAIVFDFNGTLSRDEPVLCEIYCELFAEHGRPLSAQEYFDELAGHSEEEIVGRWLGFAYPRAEEAIADRIARYIARADGSTIAEEARAAVRYAAERVPVAVVSGATRAEIEPVLAAAGLAGAITTIVPADDVAHGKPHPEGYLRALELLGVGDALVFEDTEAGVASAAAAGLRVLGVLGTVAPERLAAAEELVESIDVGLMRRLLG
ncbi:MAG: beta-phosphoglucomutase [Gaiellaceae bacterium]|jgi:HAD superfamily hydrolase (TIGR01509 family)|nr:beta-phosphoglucomutase [Gaiellaceae bacterium]